PLTLFGTDYPTPDGTCVRDYVHVSDLARAHLAVLPLLNERSVTFNIGTGRGHSNREIIDSVARVTGLDVPWAAGPRRPGDPPYLVASPARLMAATGWQPEFAHIDKIVETVFAWRNQHPHGYSS
ncbi:MAG: NAD-dependent epimerase/dehydratase family protein, partial [Acetobacter orientalis]